MTSEMEESKRLMKELHDIFINPEEDEGYQKVRFCLDGQRALSNFVAHCIFNSYNKSAYEQMVNVFCNNVRKDIKRYNEKDTT